MEHTRRQIEKRTAAVPPRPYHRCCINALITVHWKTESREAGGPLGCSGVILLHQSDTVNRTIENIRAIQPHITSVDAAPHIFYQAR